MIWIDIDMPEKCGLCPLFHAEHPMHCQGIKADRKKKIVAPYRDPRPEWCPINEVTADTDTVSRKQVIDALFINRDPVFHNSADFEGTLYDISNLPPSPTPNRPKGHWIKGKMWSEGIGMGETYGFYYTCSECNSSVKGGYDECGKNFCEKCGADMREDAEEAKKCDTCKHEKERWFSRCADCSDYELWESKE